MIKVQLLMHQHGKSILIGVISSFREKEYVQLIGFKAKWIQLRLPKDFKTCVKALFFVLSNVSFLVISMNYKSGGEN